MKLFVSDKFRLYWYKYWWCNMKTSISLFYRLFLSFEYVETKYTPLNTFYYNKETLYNKQPDGTKHSILNVSNI